MREIKENYRLYNPDDTQKLLKDRNIISKISKYEYDRKRKREEKKDWYYTSLNVVKNPALIFGKFIPYTLEKNEEKENKDKYLELVIKETNFLLQNTNLLKSLHERIEHWIKNMGNNFEKFEATTSWRLVIGLGASHPQETSMTLHHIYGIPYIPGSAIKGVTRYWAILKFAEEMCKNENLEFEKAIEKVSKALENGEKIDLKVEDLEFNQLIEIFGTQKQQGKVIFFDAYPVGEINLKIDVMNPHYPEYYSKGQAPTDWQNPIPIKFLTVENTKFQFYLAVRGENSNKILEKTKELCLKALKEHGIGAKTSLGYGIFEEINT
jgi:CRISPR-associated protein Cmr6